MITLSNDKITLQINEHGAELSSIKAGGNEYLWQADPEFWNRHSPILFPFVGRVWNNVYRHEGKVYQMGQHGFARDMDFTVKSKNDHEAVFSLESNQETIAKYPFPFKLEISYVLYGKYIAVVWKVENTGGKDMHFQIGAHPAFYYRDLDTATDKRGFLAFGKNTKSLVYTFPTVKGCTPCITRTLELDGGVMELTTSSFDCDTYIFGDRQVNRITLCDKQCRPYLSMSFDTPLVAVWSPSATRPDVPFVCLEPWFGRCDRTEYEGELKDRDCMEHLAPGATFCDGYIIKIEDI